MTIAATVVTEAGDAALREVVQGLLHGIESGSASRRHVTHLHPRHHILIQAFTVAGDAFA